MAEKHFDEDEFMNKRVLNNRELAVYVIKEYLSRYQESLDLINSALAGGNSDEVRTSAHSFKGMVGNFSQSAHAASKKLEDSGSSGDLSSAPEDFDVVVSIAGQLAIEMEAFVAENEEA